MIEAVQVIVDSRIRIPRSEIAPEVVNELCDGFTYPNPERASALRQRLAWAHKMPEFVCTARRSPKEISLPRGGMTRMRDVFERHGIAYQAVDERCRGTAVKLKVAKHLAPRPYQEDIRDAGEQLEQMIARSPTGSGKTIAMMFLIEAIGTNTLIVVSRGALLEQWQDEVRRCLGIEPGVIAGQKRVIREVTIGMQQTLANCVEAYADTFGCVIVDEVHGCAAPTFAKVVDVLPARYRFGVSADERRKDGKDFWIRDMFSDVAVEVPEKMLEEIGAIAQLTVELIETEFDHAPWHKLRELEARSNLDGEEQEYLNEHKRGAFTALLEAMSADDHRDAVALQWLAEQLAAGEACVLLGDRREHVARLRAAAHALFPDVAQGFLLGGNADRPEFRRTIAGLKSGEIRIGFGTFQAFSTGLDVPELSRLLACTPIHLNRTKFQQTGGRIRRPQGSPPVMGVLFDRRVWGDAMVRAIRRWTKHVRVRCLDGTVVDAKEYLR